MGSFFEQRIFCKTGVEMSFCWMDALARDKLFFRRCCINGIGTNVGWSEQIFEFSDLPALSRKFVGPLNTLQSQFIGVVEKEKLCFHGRSRRPGRWLRMRIQCFYLKIEGFQASVFRVHPSKTQTMTSPGSSEPGMSAEMGTEKLPTIVASAGTAGERTGFSPTVND